ncbi:hypothetical protein [Tumebacillus flagellatus]|nr:hypothetical protein [Tumebacillus flagellatus]
MKIRFYVIALLVTMIVLLVGSVNRGMLRTVLGSLMMSKISANTSPGKR